MSPELALMIFMTPIFTDKAELTLEVFKGGAWVGGPQIGTQARAY